MNLAAPSNAISRLRQWAALSDDTTGLRDDVLELLSIAKTRGDSYDELIYAVARKFPDETRHQTALRYIRQAEAPRDEQVAAADHPKEAA